MKAETKFLSGEQLLDLVAHHGISGTRHLAVFNAVSPAGLVSAQQVLLENGFYLTESVMDEGHYYAQTFMNETDEWPYWVKLRFLTDGASTPPLALVYRKDGKLHQFLGHRATTFGTGTSDAEKMVTAFHKEHGDHPFMWVPAFADTPLVNWL